MRNSKRAHIRAKRADDVCKELRYQIAKYGGIVDNQRLLELLLKWMNVSLKDRYDRPK